MRLLFFYLALAFPTLLSAQTMLESHEWCGKKHRFTFENTLNLADERSDSIDIVRTDIHLDLRALPQVKASCKLTFLAKISGINTIRLDLQTLTVDSVRTESGTPLAFTHSGSDLTIDFSGAISTVDQTQIQIFYHGVPSMDASGWGGYYNTSGYTFNLGVGFAADPHSFGRAWFPCFDNFVERSSFGITILSATGKKGFANGHLVQEMDVPGGISQTWELEASIPSYLACFASGPYTSFKRNYVGATGIIPLEIAAAPSDTNKVKASFINLQKAIDVYEDWFGPYQWNKIGYSLVPFNNGAMEHATNIAIGRSYIDGSLNFETLWAHELSHMWWGDLATCSTAEDMWLNEGWASYCEHLFTEKVYGQTAFRTAVRANHLNILQNAHVNEEGYLAVSGVPHNLTYGAHVYNKGASVAHNLRGYLGDSLFRLGCRTAMAGTQFNDWSSEEFRDKLEAATDKDLDDFFKDWVFAGGYPDYTIDSIVLIYSAVDAPTIARLFVKQKLRGAPHFHQNVPLEFTFIMGDGQRQYKTGLVSGENAVLEFEFSAWAPAPVTAFVNTNQKILQARSEGEKMLKTTGGSNFADAKFSLTVNSLGADSVLFRVEHHFASPDQAGANPNGYVLSNRYWTVQSASGNFPAGFDAQAILQFDGRGSADQLDTELFAATSPSEDSVLFLYRPGPGHPWQQWPYYTKLNLGSASDKYGQLRPTQLKTGEYTIGKGVSTIGTTETVRQVSVQIAPNPSKGKTTVVAAEPFEQVSLINAEGQTEKTWNSQGISQIELDLGSFPAGNYWLLLSGKNWTSVCPVVVL